MDNLPREVIVMWTCPCACEYQETFDLKAKPYVRTHQCTICKRILEIHRPKIVDLTSAEGGKR